MMENQFRAAFNEFLAWYSREFGVKEKLDKWFVEVAGLDKKYYTRWTVVGLLPQEGNWEQFQRKVTTGRERHEELRRRLSELTALLDLSRTKTRQARAGRAGAKVVASGIDQYFADFVDIVEPWQELFRESRCLDLAVMYSSTWRNTYLKFMKEMLGMSHSRLRVVLPTLEPSLLRAYSARLSTPLATLEGRIKDAFDEFKALAAYGGVEIYTTNSYLNHALYLFDKAGVLAFYSFRTDRCSTPALLMRSGDLLDFARKDFAWLVSRRNSASKLVFGSRRGLRPRAAPQD